MCLQTKIRFYDGTRWAESIGTTFGTIPQILTGNTDEKGRFIHHYYFKNGKLLQHISVVMLMPCFVGVEAKGGGRGGGRSGGRRSSSRRYSGGSSGGYGG